MNQQAKGAKMRVGDLARIATFSKYYHQNKDVSGNVGIILKILRNKSATLQLSDGRRVLCNIAWLEVINASR